MKNCPCCNSSKFIQNKENKVCMRCGYLWESLNKLKRKIDKRIEENADE